MAITEQSRNRLRTYLEEAMGEEQASAMMDHLLPVGWTDLATSREVTDLRDETAREFKTLRAEISTFRDETTREFKAVRTEMAGEFKAVRAEMHIGMTELRGGLDRAFHRQTLALIGLTITLGATMTAALRF